MKTIEWRGRQFDVHDDWLDACGEYFIVNGGSHNYPTVSVISYGDGHWRLSCVPDMKFISELQAVMLLRESPLWVKQHYFRTSGPR